ncbi:hypothetical protein C2W62_09140 [Candidatus Entotheonella serta]|nr:hypothetical protein C2W62_09140 [Candidatus Entotheonella serta]
MVYRMIIAGVMVAVALVGRPQTEPLRKPHVATADALPLTKIVLYTSGVGYFQREGNVEGNQRLSLRFKTDDINDLLKSLVVQDLSGGQVAAVAYDSRDPIRKALKSFAIDLTDNPGMGALLQQLRGEPIELAAPGLVKGTIIGVETKQEAVGKDRKVVNTDYLNVLTADGFRSLALHQIQRLSLLNPQLEGELHQALAVLAAGHDTQKKTVVFDFTGTGQRQVRVAYIAAAPVWKTSYRLVLSENRPPLLQGWAIVENTSDDDWHNIDLSLVSGRPVSFVMDMYSPLYVPRPEVVPELYASLRPPEYHQALDAPAEPSGLRAERGLQEADASGRAKKKKPSAPAQPQALPSMSLMTAPPPPEDRHFELQRSVVSAAQATELGELFEYAIDAPVSLNRQTSAMLPIVNEAVAATKLSIYNANVHPKHPLHGLRLKNVTKLYLMQGPVTVFEAAAYAGDARLADLAPGQTRLISYAMDLKTEVQTTAPEREQELVTVRLQKGTLIATRRVMAEQRYTVRNRDQKAKTILIEHPYRADWELKQPLKPTERTRDQYRFTVDVAPDQTAELHVREEQPREQILRLSDAGPKVILAYIRAPQIDGKVKQALQQVVTLRRQLDATVEQRQQREQQIRNMANEQQRIGQNMERLDRNSSLYTRYVSKLDQQESTIETLQQAIAQDMATEQQQRQALQRFLLSLTLP